MKHLAKLLPCLFLFLSCAPKSQVEGEYSHSVNVNSLTVEPGNREMEISWKKQGPGTISGYDVYISKQPLAGKYQARRLDPSVKPFNETPYPGDTDPDDPIEHFTAKGLENGIKYFVSVRVVFPDGTFSAPTNEVAAACGPRGEIELAVRFKSDHDGFSFEKIDYVRADNVDNDLYFSTQDGADYLGSPTRLDGFINDTRFVVLPFKGDLAAVESQLMNTEIAATADRVEVKVGDWVLATTQRKSHALLHVLSMSGEKEDRTVRLSYVYSTVMGEVFF